MYENRGDGYSHVGYRPWLIMLIVLLFIVTLYMLHNVSYITMNKCNIRMLDNTFEEKVYINYKGLKFRINLLILGFRVE